MRVLSALNKGYERQNLKDVYIRNGRMSIEGWYFKNDYREESALP